MMLLWKCKEVMTYVTDATFYKNHYLLVLIFLNISLLVKYLVKDIVFEQEFRKEIEKETQLSNVFSEEIISISSGVVLKNYINCIKKTWQNRTA